MSRRTIAILLAFFLLWGFANSLNHLMIHKVMEVFAISRLRAAWLQPAYYFAYLAAALPASRFVARWGFAAVVRVALGLFTVSSLLASVGYLDLRFGLLLLAVSMMAAGASVLESSVPPALMSSAEGASAARRLYLGQAFTSLGQIAAAALGTFVVLSDAPSARAGRLQESASVFAIQPYCLIGAAAAAIFVLSFRVHFPLADSCAPRSRAGLFDPMKSKRFVLTWLTGFVYIGVQTCIWSFLLQYARANGVATDRTAGELLLGSMVLFAAGRLLQVRAASKLGGARALLYGGVGGAVCCAIAVAHPGRLGCAALVVSSLAMSPIYPALYVAAMEATGADRATAGGWMVLCIGAGGLCPLLMARVCATSGSYAAGFAIPLAGFVWLAAYAVASRRARNASPAAGAAHLLAPAER